MPFAASSCSSDCSMFEPHRRGRSRAAGAHDRGLLEPEEIRPQRSDLVGDHRGTLGRPRGPATCWAASKRERLLGRRYVLAFPISSSPRNRLTTGALAEHNAPAPPTRAITNYSE